LAEARLSFEARVPRPGFFVIGAARSNRRSIFHPGGRPAWRAKRLSHSCWTSSMP